MSFFLDTHIIPNKKEYILYVPIDKICIQPKKNKLQYFEINIKNISNNWVCVNIKHIIKLAVDQLKLSFDNGAHIKYIIFTNDISQKMFVKLLPIGNKLKFKPTINKNGEKNIYSIK